MSVRLEEARAALASHDWAAALDAAIAAEVDCDGQPALTAERHDLEAEASWWLGRLDDCIAAREQAYLTYDELGERRAAGQCAVWLYEHHTMAARPAMAGGWLRRARRVLEDDHCVAFGMLRLREAERAHGAGQLEEAQRITEQVVRLARDLRSADLEAEALQAVGRVLIEQGQVEEGMEHLDEAMLFAVEGRLGPYSTGKVYCSLISACEDLGDLDRAAEWTDATLRWSERHPFAIFPGICRVHRAVVLKRRGSLAEAEQEASRACTELLGSHVGNAAAAWAEVGDIRRRLGDLDRAEDAFEEAQRLCGQPCGGLSVLRLAQGRTAMAVSTITICLETSSTPLARGSLLPQAVQVWIAADELDAAERAADELEEVAKRFGTTVLLAAAATSRGRLHLARHDEVAPAVLREALEQWQAMAVPYEVATARTLLAQALQDAGDEARAVQAFQTAAREFDQIGAHQDARLALGDAEVERPGGLTGREVEVLQLIAAGMTNNEAAAELFLSAKTVSRHLSNIFTKIGVSSRSGATAYAFEHHLVGEPR